MARLNAQQYNVKEIRDVFYQTPGSKQVAKQFYEQMKPVSDSIPLLFGYKGMADLMVCYHAFNPVTKLKYFYKGIHKLDKAIEDDKANVELRYLRFSVQCNVPPIVNYRANIDEDKSAIIGYLVKSSSKKADEDLFNRMKEFMSTNKKCSKEEKEKLKKL